MALMKDRETSGVAWLGDGSMIKCIPLLNMLTLCGEEPTVVISIFDYIDHLSEGGKGCTIYWAVIQGQIC